MGCAISNISTRFLKKAIDYVNRVKIFTYRTNKILLLFTQYKTTCLSVISSHCLAASPAIDV